MDRGYFLHLFALFVTMFIIGMFFFFSLVKTGVVDTDVCNKKIGLMYIDEFKKCLN